MKKKFNAPKTFQSRKVNQEKTRKINQEYFKDIDLVEVRELIKIFESIYSDIRVAEVWFLKKKEMGDGFEDFHLDYGPSNGGHNGISSTINVNLGVCQLEDEEEKNEKETGNADEENEDDENGQVKDSNDALNEQAHGKRPEPRMEVEGMEKTTNEGQIILLGKNIEEEDKEEDEEAEASDDESVKVESVIQVLSRELTPEEENKINLAKKELQNIKNGGCLTSGDICKYFDYLEGQDKQLCKNFPGRKPSLFHSTDFITFDSDGICKYLKKNRISKIDISKTRNIFIPIHKGNHFTCVVIFLDKKQISYYDSLLATNRTRTGCAHKKELQEKILGVVMQYLQDEFKKNGYNSIDENDWSLNTNCNVPQQENTEDCGIFVCLYCEFILNDCSLDFTQDDIRNGEWRKKMVLSILSIDNDDNDVYDPVVCIETPSPEIASHLTWARGTKNHVRIDNFELSKICHENSRCCYECDDNCNGKDNCNNKRIQRNQWKNVVKRDSGNKKKGFGLFLEEGCRKDDFIIEYTGKVTKTIGRKYSMKIKPPESIRKEKTVYIDAKIDGGLAKYINHSCNPNCKPFQWYVEGLPRMCFFAKRDIEKGAELTFDYQWANVMGKKSTKCLCGEENCRGYIEK